MTLCFIIGPTAVGKTALAIDWARANNAEILCADAPLVTRGMDIGTAKPTKAEQAAVKHHGVDLVGPLERFSVADYTAMAQRVVAEVTGRGKTLLVVGGSGFYLKSFFEPVTDGIEIPEPVTEGVLKVFEEKGLAGLMKELERVGGENFEGLDTKNPRRVIKALERCLATGKTFQEINKAYKEQPAPFPNVEKRVIQILREKDDLENRIRLRVEQMISAGLIDEVKKLRAEGFEKNPQAALVIGYRETLQYLDGKLTLPQLSALIAQDTLQLVRKQRALFRQLPVNESVLLSPNEKPSLRMLF